MLQKGDILIVTNIDRIARNVREGIQLLEELLERGVILHVLNVGVFNNFPTSKPKPKNYTDKNETLVNALELFANRAEYKMAVKKIYEITKVTRSSL